MALALVLVLAAALAVQLGLWAWIQAGWRRAVEASPEPAGGGSAEDGSAEDGSAAPPLPISVIVAAHDEAERLPALLNALAAQTHRSADGDALFEIVVVDDRSTDGTADAVTSRADGFPAPLRLVRIAPDDAPETVYYPPGLWSGEAEVAMAPKKRALTRGIAAAHHERLAFTDADTAPPPTWLATLARHASTGDAGAGDAAAGDAGAGDAIGASDAPRPTRMPVRAQRAVPLPRTALPRNPASGIADALPRNPASGHADGHADGHAVLVGYGPLTGDGLLGRFARYETTVTALLSAAAIGHGRPWHAVGRNLSYTRATFEAADGFRPFAESLSGDDDLFVQQVARRGTAPVRAVLDAAAFVPSPAPPTWRAFWRQKRRHSSGGAFYDARVLRALGALQASRAVLWVGAPVLHLVFGAPWGWGLLAARLLVQRAVLSNAWETLGAEGDLRLWHPVLDALYTAYQGVAATLSLLPVPRRW